MNYQTTVTQKGQVTIPVEIRRLFNLKPYQKVVFVQTKYNVLLKPSLNFYDLKGSIKSNKKYSDKKADKKVADFIKSQYEEKNSRS